MKLHGKHRRTLRVVFGDPLRADVPWADIEALLVGLGAELTQGRGSRVRVCLNEVRAVLHRPHPQKDTDRGALKSVRRFLQEAGIRPEEGDNA